MRPSPRALPRSPLALSDATSTEDLTDEVIPQVGSAPSSRQRLDDYLGMVLEDRYVVESLLGEGGMGFIYLGRHQLIDKRVAIKILRSDLADDEEMTERFLNEAKAASSIGDPHIVDISDYGRLPDGAAFFVMEFLDGVSLSQEIRRETIPVPRILHITKQIAGALASAHVRGIVHRDLKPDNVMLVTRGNDDDFVKVFDFGIAKIGRESARLTRTGTVFGTPHYMSPEQAAGVPVDRRTDIYSLGVILYELVAGRVPFDADNFMGILTQHMYKAPAAIRMSADESREVPAGLEAIILKCLSKKAELRYQTMEELIYELETFERGMIPDAVSAITGRHAGLDTPDYFYTPNALGQVAAVRDASDSSGGKRLVWGALFGAFVFLGLIAMAIVVTSFRSKPQANANASATPPPPFPSEPTPPVVGTASADSVDPPQITVTKTAVTVTIDPVDATIALEDDKADAPQPQPRTLTLASDEKIAIRIERPGFKTQRYVVDGKKLPLSGRLLLRLEHELPRAVAPPPARPAQTPLKPSAAPAPAHTTRPPSCPGEDWDPFLMKCNAKKR